MIDASVVVPTHNRLHLLPATIYSILHQKDVDFQLIIVNDGSTDGTERWIGRLAASHPRVTVINHEKPRGPSAARNAGIARATGRWIAFCDDDDLWASDKLAAQLNALRASAARWACTSAVLVNENLEIIGHQLVRGGEVLSDLIQRNTIWSGSSVIADATLLRDLGGFDPMLNACEDWDLWIRLAQQSPLAAVERPLLAHRQSSGSLSANVDQMRLGHSIVVSRYAALATPHEVEAADMDYERFLAKQLLRSGSGLKAAAIFARSFLEHRRWRDLPRIAAAAVAPRLTDHIGNRRAAAAVPPTWKVEVNNWLRRFREQGVTAMPELQPAELLTLAS